MKRLILFLLLIFLSPLYSLEIWLNGQLFEVYTVEQINDLSYQLPHSSQSGIYVKELIPLMDHWTKIEIPGENLSLEDFDSDEMFIANEEGSLYLHGKSFRKISIPETININGDAIENHELLIWMDSNDQELIREIQMFSKLHKISLNFRIESNLISLLEYNLFNDKPLPDLIIYDQKKLNLMSPLLIPLNKEDYNDIKSIKSFTIKNNLYALPFKFSRQILLDDSPYEGNQSITADFGDLNVLYPLFKRLGLKNDFDINDKAISATFFYLKNLYKQKIFKLSQDSVEDFKNGEMEFFYGSSDIFKNLDITKLYLTKGKLPQLSGINPAPLLNFRLMSIPKRSKKLKVSNAILSYLLTYGVQQRINPENGYLPYRSDTYVLLEDSIAKSYLLENLEESIILPPGDTWDLLRILFPRIYRLVITDRLSINEAIKEMSRQLENLQ